MKKISDQVKDRVMEQITKELIARGLLIKFDRF